MTFSQNLVVALLRPLINALFSWRVEGRENVPLNGPLILASNHTHVLDPVLIGLCFPRWVTFLAKEELFRSPFLRVWVRWAGSFSVDRKGKIHERYRALESTIRTLEGGAAIGIFPEGKRNHDGMLREARSGCAVIASRTGAPILPVAVVGTEKVKGLSWLWKRPRIVVRIGTPFMLSAASTGRGRAARQSLTTEVMKEIAALMPSEYRGAYG